MASGGCAVTSTKVAATSTDVTVKKLTALAHPAKVR